MRSVNSPGAGAPLDLVTDVMIEQEAARRDEALVAAAIQVVNDPAVAVVRVLVHGHVNTYVVVGQPEAANRPTPATGERAPTSNGCVAAPTTPITPITPARRAFLAQCWRQLQLLRDRHRHEDQQTASSSGGHVPPLAP